MYNICEKYPNIFSKIESLLKPSSSSPTKQGKNALSSSNSSSFNDNDSVINKILKYRKINSFLV